MNNVQPGLQRQQAVYRVGDAPEYTGVYLVSMKYSRKDADSPSNFVKFMHNVAAFGHGQITGNAFNRDGQRFVPVKRLGGRNQLIKLASLVTDKGVYHGFVSLPDFVFDRIGYVFSSALQLFDNWLIDKALIGQEYQSPASPFEADSLCSGFGRIVVGIASGSVALVRLAILVTSVALQAVLWVASKAVEYLVIKLLYQIMKYSLLFLWGTALVASWIGLGIVAIPVDIAKLLAWFLSLGWFTAKLPINRSTFGEVYRAFEGLKSQLTNSADLRPQREESSDPGPEIAHHDGMKDDSVRNLTPRRAADILKKPPEYSAQYVEPPLDQPAPLDPL